MTHPPKLAEWLLRTFTGGHSREALLGDLIEERGRGRGRGWFWSQVVAAAGTGVVSQVRAHPLATLRALAVGCIGHFLMLRVFARAVPLAQVLIELYVPTPPGRYMATGEWMEGVLSPLVTPVPVPWQAALYDPFLLYASGFTAACITGWFVGITHRRLRIVAVAFAALALTAATWPPLLWPRPASAHPILALPVWDALRPLFPILTFAGVLLGGRWARGVTWQG